MDLLFHDDPPLSQHDPFSDEEPEEDIECVS